MTRSFTAQDLIQLPSLSAEDTVALATELATAAKAIGRLPGPLVETLGDLKNAREGLLAEIQKRSAASELDPKAARAADAVLDSAWSAFSTWLGAWGEIDNTHREAAQAAFARLFPAGLAFLTRKYKAEWAESEARLQIIAREKIDVMVDALGGAPFLKALRRAHDAYGEALGITHAKPAASPSANVRDARDAALAAMRDYVAQVAATVRRRKPETEALATALLRPISAWQPARRTPPSIPTPAPPIVVPANGDAAVGES
jgi:hypothetical protein